MTRLLAQVPHCYEASCFRKDHSVTNPEPSSSQVEGSGTVEDVGGAKVNLASSQEKVQEVGSKLSHVKGPVPLNALVTVPVPSKK